MTKIMKIMMIITARGEHFLTNNDNKNEEETESNDDDDD